MTCLNQKRSESPQGIWMYPWQQAPRAHINRGSTKGDSPSWILAKPVRTFTAGLYTAAHAGSLIMHGVWASLMCLVFELRKLTQASLCCGIFMGIVSACYHQGHFQPTLQVCNTDEVLKCYYLVNLLNAFFSLVGSFWGSVCQEWHSCQSLKM